MGFVSVSLFLGLSYSTVFLVVPIISQTLPHFLVNQMQWWLNLEGSWCADLAVCQRYSAIHAEFTLSDP